MHHREVMREMLEVKRMETRWLATGLNTFACMAVMAAAPVCTNVRIARIAGSSDMGVFFDLDVDAIVTVSSLQTNGVPVSPDLYPSLGGRYVAAGQNRKLVWSAQKDWPDQKLEKVKAFVTAWSLDVPPPYMVVNLTNQNDVAYYDSTNAIPFGVTNKMYKTTHLVMAKIPAAGRTWTIGSLDGEHATAAREVRHHVAFTDDYYMGIYEFTYGQWWQFLNTTPKASSYDFHTYADDLDVCPVAGCTYGQVRGGAFTALPTSTTLIGLLRERSGMAFDLPRHAQWEVACRAGCASYINVPGATMNQVAWTSSNRTQDPKASLYGSTTTHEVGLLLPNAFGLYDTLGNVLEIGRDWLYSASSNAYVASVGLTDETLSTVVRIDPEINATSVVGGDGVTYTAANSSLNGGVGRWGGGVWGNNASSQTNPSRWAASGGSSQPDTGFRVMCSVKNGGRLSN